jgi:arylsulfatase A-like enzyme
MPEGGAGHGAPAAFADGVEKTRPSPRVRDRTSGLSRRGFLLTTAAALAPAAAPSGVVLIMADRAASLPAIPRAARFTRCYTADPDAVRGREAILHGRFPHLGGLTESPGGIALPDVLKSAGQRCIVLDRPADIPSGDDTLLVFTAARAGDDETWLDKSTRVPLLFYWPRRIAAAEFDLLVSTVDIMPTILGLCRVPAPEGLQGVDLSPWLLRGAGTRPESVYAEGRLGTRQSWRMIVRGLDKLVFNPRLDVLHLYNLGQDPDETTDLAGDPAEDRKRDEMRAIAADWMRRLGDHTDPSGLKRR